MEVDEVANECIASAWNAEISVIALQAPTEVQPGMLLLGSRGIFFSFNFNEIKSWLL